MPSNASGGQLFAEKVGQNCPLSDLVGHTKYFSAMPYKLAYPKGHASISLGSLEFYSLYSSTLLKQYRPWPLLNIKCDARPILKAGKSHKKAVSLQDLNNSSGTENLDIDTSGSGIITGYDQFSSPRNLDIKITGSGEYHGFPIMADLCKIQMSGSGTCQVAVRNSLEVRISGSGIVYYQGNPTIMDHTNRAGSIIDAN